ncbi:MAG TPA: class I SAM-dependent methyltransferase, partial [Sedimentisphaerales bacterium]|nr:class I SAM-dependent methyltransferase [Sedimentisphaerales bacterium]
MATTIAHPDAHIEVQPVGDCRNCLTIRHASGTVSVYTTSYPKELIERVLRAKSPAALIDELARDEDPLYVRICLEKDIFAYIAPEDFTGSRMLDFGCGAGASTVNLARMLPQTEIVGIDLSDKLLSAAKARAAHHGLANTSFFMCPSGQTLPDGIGQFDFILLSAVYEHLLPAERPVLLPGIWSLLKPGGVLFIDQTPWRWFPYEGHTSGLLLTNYLPDKLARLWAARFSARHLQNESWQSMLRSGIRGGSVRQIMRILNKCSE